MFRCSRSCGVGSFSSHVFRSNVETDTKAFEKWNARGTSVDSCVKCNGMGDFRNPDFSDHMFAVGARSVSLPGGARMSSGPREDFLPGRWHTNQDPAPPYIPVMGASFEEVPS